MEMYDLQILMRDSMKNEQGRKAVFKQQLKFEYEQKEAEAKAEQDKKDVMTEEESRRKNIIIWSAAGGLALLGVFLFILFNRFRIIRRQKTIIEKQKLTVDEKQKEILDSIHYAKRIQESLLPSEKYIERSLKRLKK